MLLGALKHQKVAAVLPFGDQLHDQHGHEDRRDFGERERQPHQVLRGAREQVDQRNDEHHALQNREQRSSAALLCRLIERPQDVGDAVKRDAHRENPQRRFKLCGGFGGQPHKEPADGNGKQLENEQDNEAHDFRHRQRKAEDVAHALVVALAVERTANGHQRGCRAVDEDERHVERRQTDGDDLHAHRTCRGEDDGVDKRRPQKIADVDQCGRQARVENAEQDSDVLGRHPDKAHRPLLGGEVEHQQQRACGVARHGRPACARDAPAEACHVDIVERKVDDIGDDGQGDRQLFHAVGAHIGGGAAVEHDQGAADPQRNDVGEGLRIELSALREQHGGRLCQQYACRHHQRRHQNAEEHGKGECFVRALVVALALVHGGKRVAAVDEDAEYDVLDKENGRCQVHRRQCVGAEDVADHDVVDDRRKVERRAHGEGGNKVFVEFFSQQGALSFCHGGHLLKLLLSKNCSEESAAMKSSTYFSLLGFQKKPIFASAWVV